MFLTASELAGSCGWWFCLKAKPKREHIAAAYLRESSGIDVFCPRVRFRKQTARGLVWFIEPMFPGYLFARFEYDASHRLVRQGRGISGFVQFGDRFGLLPDLLIEELKARVGESEMVEVAPSFVPGQNVQISQGPFQGREALVTRYIAAKDRVEVLIEWMGRSLRAEANAADLLTLGAAGPVRI